MSRMGEEGSVDDTLSDEMDDSEDGEAQDSDELRWSESFDDVEAQCFRQHVGPTRRLPQSASVLDYFLVLLHQRFLKLSLYWSKDEWFISQP